MAGSMRWYIYVDDADQEWGVFLDETTGSVTDLGFTAVGTNTQLRQLPKGHKMRYINCTKMSGTAAGFVQTQFPVGTLGAQAWVQQNKTITVGSDSYVKTSRRGEAVRLVIGTNTGQTGTTP